MAAKSANKKKQAQKVGFDVAPNPLDVVTNPMDLSTEDDEEIRIMELELAILRKKRALAQQKSSSSSSASQMTDPTPKATKLEVTLDPHAPPPQMTAPTPKATKMEVK